MLKKPLRYWIPVLAFAALIFGASSIPGDGSPMIPFGETFLPAWIAHNPDKALHAAIYAVFGWLCLRAMARGSAVPFPQAALLALLIAAFYGAGDEWHQSFTPRRSCDYKDWLADVAGSFTAILIFYPIYARFRRNQRASCGVLESPAPSP